MQHHRNSPHSSTNNFSLYLNQLGIDSRFVLGTWSLGGSHFGSYDTRLATDVIQKSYDYGIRQFDCASFYAKGQSQAILRQALLSKQSDSYLIHLKAGLRWKGNAVLHDGTQDHITDTVLAALKFFKRDRLDVFLLHWPDPNTDIRIACDTLTALRQDGKLACWGLCNLTENHLSLVQGYDYDVCHFHYNPLHRETEKVMKMMVSEGVVTMGYSPFEQGLLVNLDYSYSKVFGKRDVRKRNPYFLNQAIKRSLQELFGLDTAGFSYSHCILQWLLDQSCLHSIIFGVRYQEHLDEINAFLKLSKSDINLLQRSLFYQRLNLTF